MILLSIPIQIALFLLGFLLAKNLIDKKLAHLTFENSFSHSKPMMTLSLLITTPILVGIVAYNVESFFASLPLLYQKYSLLITWLSILTLLALLSAFMLTVTFYTQREKFKSYLMALAILNILTLLTFYQRNLYGGNDLQQFTYHDALVTQSTNYSCTSASISSVARGFEMNVTEKEVAKVSRLTKNGANTGQVRFTLHQLGIGYHTLTRTFNDPNKIQAPAILYVDHPTTGRESHAVVYLGKKDSKFEIWNPLGYKMNLNEEEFREIWHGIGEECSRK